MTAPTVASSNSGIQYELGAAVPAQYTCTDEEEGSGVARCTAPTSLDTSSIGVKSYEVTTEDHAGNNRTVTISYTVVYAYGEVRQPINPDGSSVFRRGGTIPVKFALTDADGYSVGTAVATLSFRAGNGEVVVGDPVEESTSTSAATAGNRFRWDASSQQYIFNLATRSMTAGTYRLVVDLDDGTRYTAVITLK